MFENTSSFDFSSPFDGYVSDPSVGGSWLESEVYSPWDDHSFSNVVGEPTSYFEQTTGFTCAVVSQQMILNDFGIPVSEAQLVYDAMSNGWLHEGGTNIDNMGQLLEYHGIPTHTNHDGDMSSLINELAHGHKVIIPVNSSELWNGVSWWERLTGTHNTGPDHAVVVSGVDFSDPNNPQVIINDPGTPTGGPQAYPLNHFLESWNDSNFTYLATDTAPSGLAQDSMFGAHFNESTGMYSTLEFWFDVASTVAGTVIADSVVSEHCPSDASASQFVSDFVPLWDTMTDIVKDNLFLSI